MMQPEDSPLVYSIWSLLSLTVLALFFVGTRRLVPSSILEKLQAHRRINISEDDWHVGCSDADDQMNEQDLEDFDEDKESFSNGSSHRMDAERASYGATERSPVAKHTRGSWVDPDRDSGAGFNTPGGADVYDSLIDTSQRRQRIHSAQRRFEQLDDDVYSMARAGSAAALLCDDNTDGMTDIGRSCLYSTCSYGRSHTPTEAAQQVFPLQRTATEAVPHGCEPDVRGNQQPTSATASSIRYCTLD
eukprot:6205611-Pleurochrysis_carterae.AAC.4